MQHVCIMCRQKSDRSKQQVMMRILDILSRSCVKCLDPRMCHHYNWGSTVKCKYGIPCQYLEMSNRECYQLSKEIESYLPDLINSRNSEVYLKVKRLLGGTFSSVYSQFERNWGNVK